MTEYEYQGPGGFHLNGGDTYLTPGDTVEMEDGPPLAFEEHFEEVKSDSSVSAGEGGSSEDEDISPSESEESESDGDEPAQNRSESIASTLNPNELTISELEAELDAGEYSESELEAVLSVEEDGEDRAGAKDAINDKLAEM